MVSMSRAGNHTRSSLQLPKELPGQISSPTSGCAHTAFDAWIPSGSVLGNWLLTRSCWFSRRRRRISSCSGRVGPSRGIPSSSSARITQLRILCPDGPNSLASGSGLPPARTSSTNCCRNSGGQREWDFGTVRAPSFSLQGMKCHEIGSAPGRRNPEIWSPGSPASSPRIWRACVQQPTHSTPASSRFRPGFYLLPQPQLQEYRALGGCPGNRPHSRPL